ncbi:hypothetical protein K501DRAFT_253973 [Backusella circina FSU 941]|nr:hypothetical protein K501DRAFT_253973 [Backusella circina FSU 941]
MNPSLVDQALKNRKPKDIAADLVPDLHTLLPKKGLRTELDSHDAELTRHTITKSNSKSIPPVTDNKRISVIMTKDDGVEELLVDTPGSIYSRSNALIPNWYRIGWTSFSNAKNPGGSLNIKATEKENDPLSEILPLVLFGEWYHNASALLLTGLAGYGLACLGGGLGSVLLFILFIASYYHTSVKRFRRNARDDIQRELAQLTFDDSEETVEWLNSFLKKFWVIFEPVISALVIENLDNYLNDYLPPYLDAIRLSTFTLGSKPFRIDSVKNFSNTDPDIVCMDWKVSFIPNDTHDLTEKELDYKVNPKVIMSVRFGKGRMGAGFPVLVEDMAFIGHLRMQIKFMSKFPYVKIVQASFLEKPKFDYVLKPLGSDSFGFDVNVIPGLQTFIREQVHHMLGPIMYSPNVLTLDMEKFFAGDFDLTSANGILAITVISTNSMRNISKLVEGPPDSYVRFYIDHGQELDRTNVCEASYSPKWNETRYVLLNNINCLLSMELRSFRPGLRDRRLGTASIDLSNLDGETQTEQDGLNLPLLRNGKPVADLRVDLRYLPVSKPIKHEDGTIEPAAESNSGVLKLIVHECRNLPQRSNTFASIAINGIEKMNTSTVKRTGSPKYEESYEMVVLDKTSLLVRIEIKDSSKDGELLGGFSAYAIDILRQQSKNGGWWDILEDDQCVGQVRIHLEWKPTIMTGLSDFAGGLKFDSPPIGVIRFTFWGARDLRNVEHVTNGKSDPYVRILSGSQIRGRTEVIDNNLNPEWGEIVYVPIHSIKEKLILEAMDWNARTRDKSLGIVEFDPNDIIIQHVGDQNMDPDVWYEPNEIAIDRWSRLYSIDRRSSKGDLHYSAEFLPAIALPKGCDPTRESIGDTVTKKRNSHPPSAATEPKPPLYSLQGHPIKYTPDDLIDLNSYPSGIFRLKIHEVQFSRPVHAYCQVIADSLLPLYKTSRARGMDLNFEETITAFIKEKDFSRVAIEIKPARSNEKDNYKLGHLIDSGTSIIRRIMKNKRMGKTFDEDEGTWFKLLDTEGPARIRLSLDYVPLSNFVLNPDESLDNQGLLSVQLVHARNLMAADKTGTSDPYVVFTVNGEKVYKSNVIKKELNPNWTGETFKVPIQSRVTASIRIEVFDWNQVKGHVPIGSGGVTLRGDSVESFQLNKVDIPLDGVSGVSGYVQLEFNWQPQLLINKKTQSSVLGRSKTYAHHDVNLEVAGPLVRNSTSSRVSDGYARYSSDIDEMGYKQSSDIDDMGFRRSSTENLALERIDSESVMSFDDNASSVPSVSNDYGFISNTTGRDGTVMFTLLEARGLRGVDKSGTSDPFVRVSVGKIRMYKTEYIPKTLTPVWNETFSVSISSEPYMFDIKVKDHNKLKASVELGQNRINIWDFIKPDIPGGEVANCWIPLYPTGSGELHIELHYSST